MRLTVGSIYSGIGGLDLGFERAGFEVRWQVEINPFCRNALRKHWPHVPCYEDALEVRWQDLEWVDVIVAGFPCQDISNAGKRTGIEGERSWLWWRVRRAARILRPSYLVVENVAGLFHRGIDTVLGGLARIGYDAEWTAIRASDVGAPHQRKRVFIVAYPQQNPERHEQQRIERWTARYREIARQASARRLAYTAGVSRPGGDEQTDMDAARYRRPWWLSLADAESGRQRVLRRAPFGGPSGHTHGRDAAILADADNHGFDGCRQSEPAGVEGPRRREPDGCGPQREQFDAEELERSAHAGTLARVGREWDTTAGWETECWPEHTGDAMADADRDGQCVGGRPRRDGTRDERGEPLSRDGHVADAEQSGLQGSGSPVASRGRESAARRPDWPADAFWPARPGEPQHAWEPPRCLESTMGARAYGLPGGLAGWSGSAEASDRPPAGWRRAALEAIGNAVVPQVAELVAYRVLDLIEEQYR